jgi:ABC-type glycerol-3-phosphate transport system substrate-binding protein
MSNKMSRRSFLNGLAALGGGLALAACAPKEAAPAGGQDEPAKDEPKAAQKEPVTVVFKSWWGAYNSVALPPTLEELKDVIPEITVELSEGGDDAFYNTCFAAGTCPDIPYHRNHFSKFYDEDLILDLTSYYESDNLDFYNDFNHGLALCLWKGKIYGVPHMFETCVLFYNKDMIKERWGQDLWEAFPDGNWEMEDMVEVAKACTVDETGNGVPDVYGLYVYHRHYYYGMETQSWTRRDGIFDVDNVRYNFTGDGARASAHFLLDAVRGPDKFAMGQEDYAEVNKAAGVTFPFMAQKTAMRIRMCTDAGRIIGTVGVNEGAEFDWDMFHLPNYQGQQAITRAGGHPTNIAKTTEHPDECWEVCKHLGTSIGQKYICRTKMAAIAYPADESLRGELETGEPAHDNVIMDVVDKKGGYGDHMRFHTEAECRTLFTNEMDLIYNEPYEDAKARLDSVLDDVEAEMNELVDYGPGEKPYAGLPFPFKPGQVI